MACQYAQSNGRPARLDVNRFQYLRNGDVIRHWFQRGWQMRNAGIQNCFEPFIFTWIALNAWGECVTGQERDEAWVKSLAQDQSLNDSFSAYLNAPDANGYKAAAEQFRGYWPIPRVQVWRRDRSRRPATNTVHDRARFFAEHHIPSEPACALRHFDHGEQIPLDWEHFLPATYRVRCNLFHGEKSPYDPVDAEIVRASFQTLCGFMETLSQFS
jgi:hypothetical protein